MQTRIFIHINIYTYIYCTCVHMCICTCIHLCIYIYMYMCIYIYIHVPTCIHTHAHTSSSLAHIEYMVSRAATAPAPGEVPPGPAQKWPPAWGALRTAGLYGRVHAGGLLLPTNYLSCAQEGELHTLGPGVTSRKERLQDIWSRGRKGYFNTSIDNHLTSGLTTSSLWARPEEASLV